MQCPSRTTVHLTCPCPAKVALADGCHPARETVREITETFTEVFYKRFDVPYLWGNDDWFNMFPIGPQVR